MDFLLSRTVESWGMRLLMSDETFGNIMSGIAIGLAFLAVILVKV